MNKKKYPLSLFIFGFFQNFFFHFFWIFVPSAILLIVAIFVKYCLYIGIVGLIIDVIVSFIEQLLIRKACISDSDSPDFKAFQEALSADGDWKDNLDKYVNRQISNNDDISKDE